MLVYNFVTSLLLCLALILRLVSVRETKSYIESQREPLGEKERQRMTERDIYYIYIKRKRDR